MSQSQNYQTLNSKSSNAKKKCYILPSQGVWWDFFPYRQLPYKSKDHSKNRKKEKDPNPRKSLSQ